MIILYIFNYFQSLQNLRYFTEYIIINIIFIKILVIQFLEYTINNGASLKEQRYFQNVQSCNNADEIIFDERQNKQLIIKRKEKIKRTNITQKVYQAEYETIFRKFDQFFQQALVIIERIEKAWDSCKVNRFATEKSAQKYYSFGGSGWLFMSMEEVQWKQNVVRDPCKIYDGSGIVEKEFDIEIELPKGIQNGTVIRQSIQDHASKYSQEPGDLWFKVEVEEDNSLRRDANNIISELELSVNEMVLDVKNRFKRLGVLQRFQFLRLYSQGQSCKLNSMGFNMGNRNGRRETLLQFQTQRFHNN